MAAFNNIKVGFELRPCLVRYTKSDGKVYYHKAMFHRWVEYEDGYRVDRKGVEGLVEYEDGTVRRVSISLIKFLDPPHHDYYFGEEFDADNNQ